MPGEEDRNKRYQDDSASSVYFSASVNACLFCMGVILFSFLLNFDGIRRLMAPKISRVNKLPKPLLWPLQVLRDWDRKPEGVDAQVFLRFLMMGLRICVLGSLINVILLPVFNAYFEATKAAMAAQERPPNYRQSVYERAKKVGLRSMNRFSIVAIASSQSGNDGVHHWSPYAVVFSAYYMSLVVAWNLRYEYKAYVKIMHEYYEAHGDFATDAKLCSFGTAQVMRSLVAELDPDAFVSPHQINRFFAGLLHDASPGVFCVQVQKTTHLLHRLMADSAEIKKEIAKKDLAIEKRTRTLASSKSMTVRSSKKRGATTEDVALEDLKLIGKAIRKRDSNVETKFKEQVEAAMKSSRILGTTAFVTFHSLVDRLMVEQMVLANPLQEGKSVVRSVRAAPERRDIRWQNMCVTDREAISRTFVVQFSLILGLVLWAFPVAAIGAFTSLDSPDGLAQSFGWADYLDSLEANHPLMYLLLQDYLPSVCLNFMLVLLPHLLTAVSKLLEKVPQNSQVETLVLSRTLTYQIATLVCTVFGAYLGKGSSFYSRMGESVRDPKILVTAITVELPKAGWYLVCCIMTSTGAAMPLLLFRPWDWPVFFQNPGDTSVRWYMGIEACVPALVLGLAHVYALMTPAVLIACAVYFGLASFVYRFIFWFIYIPTEEGMGSYWGVLYNWSVGSFLTGLVSVFFILGNDQMSLWPMLCLSPLFLFWSHEWRHSSKYQRSAENMSLEMAVKLDKGNCGLCQTFLAYDYYRDPLVGVARAKLRGRSSRRDSSSSGTDPDVTHSESHRRSSTFSSGVSVMVEMGLLGEKDIRREDVERGHSFFAEEAHRGASTTTPLMASMGGAVAAPSPTLRLAPEATLGMGSIRSIRGDIFSPTGTGSIRGDRFSPTGTALSRGRSEEAFPELARTDSADLDMGPLDRLGKELSLRSDSSIRSPKP